MSRKGVSLGVCLVDHAEQPRHGIRWRADPGGGDLSLDRGHVDVLRNVEREDRLQEKGRLR